MEEIKWSIRAIAANRKQSVEALATDAGIEPSHLRNVSNGRAIMMAKELLALSKLTGVHPYNIETEYTR